ncbi:MAG: hypothetical protein ABMA14_15885 [Hyphomonadaceae bacterium]
MMLKPDRLRWLLVFLISLSFVAIAAWLGPDKDPMVFWGAGGFFLLCGLVAAPLMFGVGSNLALDREGFTCRTLFRSFRRTWRECTAFYPVSMGLRKFVGFSTEQDEAAHPNLAAANRKMIGATGILPDTFGLDAGELADLMNRYRARALGLNG